MIDGVNARLDLYSHLRLEVTLQPRERPRQEGRADRVDPANARNRGPTLQLETDDRGNSNRRTRQVDEEKIVPFEVSSAVVDQGDGGPGVAQEVLPALEASVLPADPFMAKVARLYSRNGQAFAEARIGTRLDVVV